MNETESGITAFKTVTTFLRVGTCSETLFNVLDRAFDHPLKPEERASMPFAGGIMQHGYQCGMVWGAALAAGAEAYRHLGPGPRAQAAAIIAAQRLVQSFLASNKYLNCFEITDLDKSASNLQLITYFLLKGGSLGCFRMAARYAPTAFSEVAAALAAAPVNPPPAPVSCAAMVAQKMGESDLHTVMAAGLAAGIGLSGGACGALGAAIWILGMNSREPGDRKTEFEHPRSVQAVEEFLKCTDYEFECSRIVGRRFATVEEHADYLRSGGCSHIIELLAAGTN